MRKTTIAVMHSRSISHGDDFTDIPTIRLPDTIRSMYLLFGFRPRGCGRWSPPRPSLDGQIWMDETRQHPGCARGSTRIIPLCCNVSRLKLVLTRPRRARVDGDHRVLVAPILWARGATRIPHARGRPARNQTRPLPIDVRKRHFCDIDGRNTLAKSVASSRQPS